MKLLIVFPLLFGAIIPAYSEVIPFDTGEYKVDFYCEPKLLAASRSNTTYGCFEGGEYFEVSRRKFEIEKLEKAKSNPEKFIEDYVDMLMEPINGSVVEIKNIGQQDEIKYSYILEEKSELPSIHKGRVTLVDGKLYDLKVVTFANNNRKPNTEKIESFFNSFVAP